MFQRTRIAAVAAIVVAIVVANTADARPSGSFRSGFSGKSNVSRNVGTQRQPSFGSFGKRQSQPPAAARAPQRDSAMSRDLDRKAAQDQALRTYDTRRYADNGANANRPGADGMAGAAAGAAPALPPLKPVLPGGQGGYGGSGGQARHSPPAGGATSAPAPVVVRDGSNGWLWGIGGFMLGHAAGSHAAAPAPAPAPAQAPGNVGAMADAAGAGDIAAVAEGSVSGSEAARAAPAPAQAQPSETSTIAKLAVLLLIGALVWLAWKAFRLMSGAQAVKKHANYSFERN